jgi:DNA polymerase-3 subunit delta
MRLNPERLVSHLEKDFASLYVISGNELLLTMEIADEIRMHAKSRGYTEREIFTVDQRFDWTSLRRWSRQLSLFSEQRVLDLRIPSGKPGKEGGAAIEAFCQDLLSDIVTIVSLPAIDKQGQASKWFKALEQAGVVIAVQPIQRSQLSYWIEKRLQRQEQTIDQDAMQFFVNKVEGNMLAAHQEVKKLALLYPSGRLSFEQIKDALLDVARYDILQLSEAMLTADVTRYSRILQGLQGEGAAPPLILAVLTEQIRVLLRIRLAINTNQGLSLAQIMKAQRVWFSQQKTISSLIHRLDQQLLVRALRHAASIDRMIKGVARGDIWEELLHLGIRFTGNNHFYIAARR